MTNGDKIRQMNDEELALFLTKFGGIRECKYCTFNPEFCEIGTCDCGHRDWLESEADE